jgi:hypothetical protein
LDGHSNLVVFPEETFYLRYVANHPGLTVLEGAEWLLTQSLCRNLALGKFESPLDGSRDYSDFDFQWFRKRFLERLSGTSQNHGEVLISLISAYAEETNQQRKPYWVEKSPLNEHRLHLASAWYDNLYAIYIVRDPRDVYVSYARKKKRESSGAKTFPVEDFLRHWAFSLWSWQNYAQIKSKSMFIRYEDLVRCPNETMSSVCHFLGISYEIALTVPSKLGELWSGNSMYEDSFEGISTKPIGRWRKRLTDEQRVLIEAYLGKAMSYLGYQVETEILSFAQMVSYWLFRTQNRQKMLGVLARLYWPFRLPPFMKRRTRL